MVAVWIILGFLAGVIFDTVVGLIYGMRTAKCSLNEYLTYAGASVKVKGKKNRTQQAVSTDINYGDYSEKLTLE